MGSTASLEPDSGVVLTCRMDFMSRSPDGFFSKLVCPVKPVGAGGCWVGVGEWDRNEVLWAKSLALTLTLLPQGQGLREFQGLG